MLGWSTGVLRVPFPQHSLQVPHSHRAEHQEWLLLAGRNLLGDLEKQLCHIQLCQGTPAP